MHLLRAPGASPPSLSRVTRARTAAKASSNNVANLVRVHDRLLKLEARVDLLLKRHSDEVDGEGGASAAAAAAASSAAAGHAEDEVAALTASAQERDIRWRVRDAVEDQFAAGWEARRTGGGGAAAGGRPPAAASPRAVPPPPKTPPKPAAAAASAAPAAAPTKPKTTTTTTTAVNVEFVVRCPFTAYGERVWLCGGAPALGKWNPKSALRLRWGEGGRWRAVAQFEVERDDQAENDMEFKALLRRDDDATDKGGRWEALERNRRLGLFFGGAVGGASDVQARASEGIRTTVLEDGTVRVEFDAGF